MTRQEIFDTVATHLFTQGEAAIEDEACVYRTNTGTTCAVGCLIPENIYDPRMERRPAEDLYKDFPALQPFLGNDPRLLGHLQTVHDSFHDGGAAWRSTENMRGALRQVAADCGNLNTTILDTLSFADR